ncbi:MAG TPA: hypothetical protein VFG42_09775 [Baekduia sp.]|uniref:hypothetical protein n=1 Tax=Baekduia sp. TaxID=2600305 RepID=UPI002D7744AD|nr:hypothetical protein [Baekduia sp.]HET6507068.1 hypothetical protein [Baekduia sp.]
MTALTARASAIGGGVLVAIGCVALVVALAGADAAREALGLTFPGLPRTLGSAEEVFAANARLLGVTAIAAAVATLLRGTGWAGRVPVALCDLALALGCALHVLLVGAALGGYGAKALAYILPHGPVELAGFSIGLALYAEARVGRLTARAAVGPVVLAIALLAVAAGLEVFTGA